jgi:hypothetical protein
MAGTLAKGMYELDFEDADMIAAWITRSRDLPASKETWHRRLVHIGDTGLSVLISRKLVNGLRVLT